jgi:hypothetical protein
LCLLGQSSKIENEISNINGLELCLTSIRYAR